MKRLVLIALVFLSGCASDLTVYKRYDVPEPAAKARLHVKRWAKYQYGDDATSRTLRKYFVNSSEKDADFILKETYSAGNGGSWLALTALTLGIVPTWGTVNYTFSYSLTHQKTDTTIAVSDITVTNRQFAGWLLIPAVFFPKVHTDNGPESNPALVQALQESALLIYNKNSRLYNPAPVKRWAPFFKEKTSETSITDAPTASETSVAPVKEKTPDDMDSVW